MQKMLQAAGVEVEKAHFQGPCFFGVGGGGVERGCARPHHLVFFEAFTVIACSYPGFNRGRP